MFDKLLYVGDAVRHWASASTREEDEEGQATGRLVPPYIVGPDNWHVSRQGDWQRTRAFSIMD